MKVLWICQFSNAVIRNRLQLSSNIVENILRKFSHIPPIEYADYAAWITNGINEFDKFKEIELHVISPHIGMTKSSETFISNGINYHFFKTENDSITQKIKRYALKQIKNDYKGNRKRVKEIVNQIDPDIIHMFGAEIPHYSITALDIDPQKYPLIVSLQTLLNDKEFKANYPISDKLYYFKAKIEKSILQKTNYIASEDQKYRDIIWKDINPNAIFFKTDLALEQIIPVVKSKKTYDFVYFAAAISKAADIAIEAFALACKKYSNLTLNIIGGTPEPFTGKLKSRIKELGIEENVIFSGKLPTHDEVLKQIQLSKYALLPLKIDIISGTIREAMFAGLPVVTTITPGTPSLNEKRESVLLSLHDDNKAIANNMFKLIENPEFARLLADNANITVNERWSNEAFMKDLVGAYNILINHHQKGMPIPPEIGTTNPYINNGN